jgi:hypothetical protein
MAQGPPPRFFNRPSSAKLGVDPMSKSLQMEVLNALAGLKKTDEKAYNALLSKLNCDRWSQISENDYGAVLMECHTRLIQPESDLSDGNVVAELGGDPQHDGPLRAIYEQAYGHKSATAKDIKIAATGKTTSDKLNAMSAFDSAARKVQANAKAE